MPRHWIPAFAGMTEVGFDGRRNALTGIGHPVSPATLAPRQTLKPASLHISLHEGGFRVPISDVSQGWLTSAARRNASVTPRAGREAQDASHAHDAGRAGKRKQPHRSSVIPGGVKRRPGIHAEALDSRFRGNDGDRIRRAWECADRDRTPCLGNNTCSPTSAEASIPPNRPSPTEAFMPPFPEDVVKPSLLRHPRKTMKLQQDNNATHSNTHRSTAPCVRIDVASP